MVPSAQLAEEGVLWRAAGHLDPRVQREHPVRLGDDRAEVEFGDLGQVAGVPGAARTALEAEFAAGNRVIAVATREAPGQSSLTAADEHALRFRGLLVFLDPPNPDAHAALRRLA